MSVSEELKTEDRNEQTKTLKKSQWAECALVVDACLTFAAGSVNIQQETLSTTAPIKSRILRCIERGNFTFHVVDGARIICWITWIGWN